MSKGIFLTDGAGIFKIKKLVRAAVLINLETKEQVTAEMLGSQVAGFAIVKLPSAERITAPPEAPDETSKRRRKKKLAVQHEPIKGKGRKKSSKYYGVTANPKSRKNPFRAQAWINSENVSAGSYPTEIAAAKAVDAELVKRGKQPRNFPQARKEG